AILVLLLVPATLPALAMTFAADPRRTRAQATDSQVRQLLTAGAVFAKTQANLDHPPTSQCALALPAELSADGAAIDVVFARPADNRLIATSRATFPPRTMQQSVDFQRGQDGKWRPIAASIN